MVRAVDGRADGGDVARDARGGLVVHREDGFDLITLVSGQPLFNLSRGDALAVGDVETLDVDAEGFSRLAGEHGEVAVDAAERAIAGRERVDQARLPRAGARARIEQNL